VEIERAEEPEDYIYEHLQYSPCATALWKLLTIMGAVVVIVLVTCLVTWCNTLVRELPHLHACAIRVLWHQNGLAAADRPTRIALTIACPLQVGLTDFAKNCHTVVEDLELGSNPNAIRMQSVCSSAGGTEAKDWYKAAFDEASALQFSSTFPMIASTENLGCVTCEEEITTVACCKTYQYDLKLVHETPSECSAAALPSWESREVPNWLDAKNASCHRVDTDGMLQKDADLDG
jgi:hypothetical protein